MVIVVSNFIFVKKPADGICTDVEKIVANVKMLEICFTQSNSIDIIFEIIKISRIS